MDDGGGQTTLWIRIGKKPHLEVVLRSIVQIHHSHSGDHLLLILHILSQKHIVTLRDTCMFISYDSSSRSDCRITLN